MASYSILILLFNNLIFKMGKFRMDWLDTEDDDYQPTVQKIKKSHSNPNKKHKKHRKDEFHKTNKEILYEETD